MYILSDKELIKNYILFHAYFCYLIKNNQADSVEDLCDISFKLDEEIKRRKIGKFQIKETIKCVKLESQDLLMVSNYIYYDLETLGKV